MNKNWLFGLLITLFATSLSAEEEKVIDPFDLSESSSKITELGIITKPEVDALENKAKELFNAENCSAAIPVLTDYAKNRIGSQI